MKIWIRTLPLVLAALLWAGTDRLALAENGAEPFRVVFIAYENPDQLMENVQPVVDYLERAMGVPIRHFVATDYSGVVEALRNGSADMGFMGPLQAVIAHRQAGAYPILGEIYNGEPTYRSKIFVRRDSGIKSIEDLKGRTMAFVDPISSSGFMYPLDIFHQKGLIEGAPEAYFKKIYFAGGDEQAIRAVYNGFVDAAGVSQYAFNLLRGNERNEVFAIAESRPIPSHCVVVRKGVGQHRVETVKEALLALNDEAHPDHALLRQLYNVDGYVPVTIDTYKETEELGLKHAFIK